MKFLIFLIFLISNFSYGATSNILSGINGGGNSNWGVYALINGSANTSLSNTGSLSEITNSGLTLTAQSGSASVEIACASGTSSSGTTCVAANESLGIAFTPTAGNYEVCADFTQLSAASGSDNSGGQAIYNLVETPNNAITDLQDGGQFSEYGLKSITANSSSYSDYHGVHVCGLFSFNDNSKRTIRIMYKASNTSTLQVVFASSSVNARITVRPR